MSREVVVAELKTYSHAWLLDVSNFLASTVSYGNRQ